MFSVRFPMVGNVGRRIAWTLAFSIMPVPLDFECVDAPQTVTSLQKMVVRTLNQKEIAWAFPRTAILSQLEVKRAVPPTAVLDSSRRTWTSMG